MLDNILQQIDPERTLFIISSKSFTTLETLTNARTILDWMKTKFGNQVIQHHFIAITASPTKAMAWGIPEENIDVSVEEGVVRISGSSQVAKEDKGMRSYFMNAISSSYDYSFQLPSGLEDGEPKAELRRGILTLRFKKTRKEAPKKVKVVSKDEEKGEGDD